MTLEESRDVIPIMEEMISLIEEQGKASLRGFKGTGTDGNHGQADQRTGSRLSRNGTN